MHLHDGLPVARPREVRVTRRDRDEPAHRQLLAGLESNFSPTPMKNDPVSTVTFSLALWMWGGILYAAGILRR